MNMINRVLLVYRKIAYQYQLASLRLHLVRKIQRQRDLYEVQLRAYETLKEQRDTWTSKTGESL